MCHKGNVCYTMECRFKECDAGYDGETHRNAYTRGLEHMRKYQRKDENSFIFKHQVEKHNSQPANFGMRVVGSFKDPLSRQVTEAVMIKNHQGTLLNSRAATIGESAPGNHSRIRRATNRCTISFF